MTAYTASLSRPAGIWAATVALVSFACSTYPPPPHTRVAEVVDTLHGVVIPDPFRWLEDPGDPETRQWIDAQNSYAEQIVGQSPLRARIEERLRQLMEAPDAPTPRRAGDYQYFSFRPSGRELPIVFRRPAPDEDDQTPIDPTGEYEIVLDPHGVSTENTTRFAMVTFSSDGKLMIYNERDGGQDEVKIRVRDLENRIDLPDSLPLSLYGSVAFADDRPGFYYVKRSREAGPRVLYHLLGSDIRQDEVIFGEGYGPETFINFSQEQDGRYMIFRVQHGWARVELHFQDLRSGSQVRAIVDDADARFYTRFIDGELYMRTDLDADKNRLVAVDLRQPERDNWREVIPEGEDLMEDFALIDDKFYVTYLRDVSNRIAVYEKDGTPAGEISIPEFHTASIRGGKEGEAFLTLSSFTTPRTVYTLDLRTGERTLWHQREVDWDPAGIVVHQVWRTAEDGARVPIYLMHRDDISLDGQNPTWLTGYGGFYVARKPTFSTTAALWVELGGVYAVATLRGGSEFGESWHRDGMLTNKQHVFDDFIAAAEWLIENRYTSSNKLAIRGSSNGGLLVGAALTQRPDLFRAVICAFPDVDILRFPWYTTSNNAPALLEYGDSRILEQFQAIRQYSPYQSIRRGTAYPAVMFTTGDLDTRVPPAAARKMTARLQAATSSARPVILRYHHKAGHAAGRGVPFSQRVRDVAMELTFVLQQLGVDVALD